MPLPTVLCLAFATGLMAALAGRAELKVSPRHPLLSRSFGGYAIFAALVLIPVSVYFYVFHGDWFLLYLLDVRDIPSAVALVGFVVEGAFGALGFALAAALLRSQREVVAGAAIGVALLAAAGSAALVRDRLAVVGSYAQFHGGFGLGAFGEGPMLQGTALMGGVLAVGLAFLLVRLWMGAGRGA